MTGRDLIVYILTNHLEDEPVIKDGLPIGFVDINKAAARRQVGAATINAWINMGLIDSFEIRGGIVVPNGGIKCIKN